VAGVKKGMKLGTTPILFGMVVAASNNEHKEIYPLPKQN
jgi:hypothetical protein